MPERPITAALQAVATILAAVAICLVLAAALHLPVGHAAPIPTPTPTSVAATPAVHPAPAPGEYIPTPAGPPTDQLAHEPTQPAHEGRQ